MARPLKEGLDYFPLDVDLDQDDKLVVPLAKFGISGFGIIIRVMMHIYKNGYFYPWGEREQYSLSSKVNVDINTVIAVVNECIDWGFFNKELHERFGVLTSRGFQKRYLEAVKRRKQITLLQQYVLIDPETECKKVSFSILIVNEDGKLINEYINPDKCNATDTVIHKVKESKVKESKVIKKHNVSPDESNNTYDAEFENFWLAYPTARRRDKAKAYKKWLIKIKTFDKYKMTECVKRYANDTKAIGRDGSYAKMPTTFLNAETYKDYQGGGSDESTGHVESPSGKFADYTIE